MKTTLNDFRSSAELCRERGWDIRTRLIGDEGYGPTIIEITGVGRNTVLAFTVSHNGAEPRYDSESCWSLSHRDWQVVPNDKLSGCIND